LPLSLARRIAAASFGAREFFPSCEGFRSTDGSSVICHHFYATFVCLMKTKLKTN
jgi:hypothetical protein